MNPQGSTDRSTKDDERLRRHLRDSLARSSAAGLQGLQSKAVEQWRQRHPPRHHVGPLAALKLQWRRHPAVARGALLALGVAGVLALHSWTQPDLGTEDLKQLDVLSLMTLGEF